VSESCVCVCAVCLPGGVQCGPDVVAECGAGVGRLRGAVGEAGHGAKARGRTRPVRGRRPAGAERCDSYFIHHTVFVCGYTLITVILCTLTIFICSRCVYKVMCVCFHREELGSSSRQLYFLLPGSGPLAVETHLTNWNQCHCPSTSLGISIFVLQINILNSSVLYVRWSFNLHLLLIVLCFSSFTFM